MPYSATVIIKDMEYGVGFGSSKKQAKSEAARISLEILIPAIREIANDSTKSSDKEVQDLSVSLAPFLYSKVNSKLEFFSSFLVFRRH